MKYLTLLLILIASPAYAQTATGSIEATVVDITTLPDCSDTVTADCIPVGAE